MRLSKSPEFVEALAKHLPPSAAQLRLVDVNGTTSPVLTGLRADLSITVAPPSLTNITPNSADAVTAYDCPLHPDFLRAALVALRPGGRLVIVNPEGTADAEWVARLEAPGYTRILVEALSGNGVLIRGEKPATTADTLERIQQVAQTDANALDFAHFQGRYVHLLIRQTPHKPTWKLQPGEPLVWEAAARATEPQPTLLVFSSLPKAVGFMQPAVIAGRVRDIHKVAKFSRDTAQNWQYPVLLNPTLDELMNHNLVFVPIDPNTAETPDE